MKLHRFFNSRFSIIIRLFPFGIVHWFLSCTCGWELLCHVQQQAQSPKVFANLKHFLMRLQMFKDCVERVEPFALR